MGFPDKLKCKRNKNAAPLNPFTVSLSLSLSLSLYAQVSGPEND